MRSYYYITDYGLLQWVRHLERRSVILSEAKDLCVRYRARPFASLRVTEPYGEYRTGVYLCYNGKTYQDENEEHI